MFIKYFANFSQTYIDSNPSFSHAVSATLQRTVTRSLFKSSSGAKFMSPPSRVDGYRALTFENVIPQSRFLKQKVRDNTLASLSADGLIHTEPHGAFPLHPVREALPFQTF